MQFEPKCAKITTKCGHIKVFVEKKRTELKR